MNANNIKTFEKLVRLYDARDYFADIRENAIMSRDEKLYTRSCKKLECLKKEIESIEAALTINK